MAINGMKKGQAGEREFCKWIHEKLKLDSKPERILGQARDSGFDVQIGNIAFEIKRHEKLEKQKWWNQVKKATNSTEYIPVVAYRQNRKKWKFLLSASWIGSKYGFIELNDRVFIKWIENKVDKAE